jgi:hypothetical protein
MENIVIKNIEILTGEEKQILSQLLAGYYPKIQRLVKTELSLEIQIKEYDKEGKKKKYSLNSKAIFAGKAIKSDSWDWDFARAVHKAMRKLETEIGHKFKITR